jgi:hypothetical protein
MGGVGFLLYLGVDLGGVLGFPPCWRLRILDVAWVFPQMARIEGARICADFCGDNSCVAQKV